jgi:tetratricopeptide (TPR) repeat protein
MRSSIRRPLITVIALLLPASAALADWKNDYDRGLRAIDAGNWSEAESAFRAALADEAQPSARKRFQGVVTKPYVPHYYAGLAAYRQGNCQRALEYWNNAASAAVVSGLADLRGAQSSGQSDCNTRLAASTRPPATTSPTAATPIATPATTPGKPPATSPTRPVASTPPPAATPTRPATQPVKPPVVASAPAPAALVTAVEGFLAGRYAAVAQLDPATISDGRSRAQAHLLRAASRFTLAQLAGGDASQLDLARRDVRAARGANASLTPDETLFSPRFRAFWRESR